MKGLSQVNVTVYLTELDVVVVLLAGLVGVFGGYRADGAWYGRSMAWGIIALWALLKLIKVL